AGVALRYLDEWHVQHLIDPRSGVPQIGMHSYSFLPDCDLNPADIASHLVALRRVGVPYTVAHIERAEADLKAQADPEADAGDLAQRYPKAQIRDFDGNPRRLTEMDALVAYLQVLGTLVDVNSAAAQEELAGEAGR